jgi:chromosome segregation ATPase
MPDNQTTPPAGTAEARAAVTASLNSVGSNLDADIRRRAADLQSNAEAISKQEAELAKQTAALAKESAQWQKLADSSTKKLNEVGDLQNWAEMIERDLLVVEETLRLAEEKPEQDNASGTNGSLWDIAPVKLQILLLAYTLLILPGQDLPKNLCK